jgi:hypothetical protein
MSVAPLLLLVMLSVSSGSCAYEEKPSTRPSFFFGLPFRLGQEDQCPVYPEGPSLADSVGECHKNVVLISSNGVCNTRTLFRFIYEHPGGGEFEATLLEKSSECPGGIVAVIGVDARAVRPIFPIDAHAPLSEELELEARRVLNESGAGKGALPAIADSSAKVVKVGRVTLLKFRTENGNSRDEPLTFAAVLSVNNNFVPLGVCTTKHLFFSVYDRLHLAYTKECCACGEVIFYVYDLSDEVPKIVYQNGNFSD